MRQRYEVFLVRIFGKQQWYFIGIQLSSKNNARQIVVLLCPKGSSCLFYYYKLLRCRIVTNLRNCFLTKLPLRMYFLMSVISFFRTDFYIEEGDGILMSGNLNSVMVHEMKSHLGLFQSSK